MSYLLNIVYLFSLVVATPWLAWRAMFQNKSRRGWRQKLLGLVSAPAKNAGVRRIWFHAVSVGEVNLLKPIVDRISARDPSIEFAISTSTETGFDLARKRFGEHCVFFCPMDFTWSVKNVLKRIKPDVLVLTELELWPNLITITSKQGVPVMVANARLSESSYRGYSRLRWIVGGVLKRISLIAVQNETYESRFIELGCKRNCVVVTGNVKFDGARTDRNTPHAESLRQIFGIEDCEHVFVAGSTQPDEDDVVLRVYQRLAQKHRELRLVLVPRHPEKLATAVDTLNALNLNYIRRSETMAGCTPGQTGFAPDKAVIVVDVIGELTAWWSLADVGYVGGSMGTRRGGQNMIEPAALGVPISFGPNTRNFQAVVESLLSANAAVVVQNEDQLADFIDSSLSDPVATGQQAERANAVVRAQQGAADATVELLLQMIPQSADDSRKHVPTAA
ncbi:MAG: 3-deoxy-D-manno-octulosonic acid transferase [Planctomycetota bacterium]